MQIADGALAIPPSAFGAIGALGLIGAALFVADPEKRCSTKFQYPLNYHLNYYHTIFPAKEG